MTIKMDEFWSLLEKSRLIRSSEFNQLKQEARRNVQDRRLTALIDWLVSQKKITRYHASILQSGHSGPFHYEKYQIYDLIRTGTPQGYFRAIHLPTHHKVLLQFIDDRSAISSDRWEILKTRIESYRHIQHPQLLRYFEIVELPSFRFLVLEALEGRSLKDHLKLQEKIPTRQAVKILYHIAQGLNALHKNRFVHGDIRPENIWFEGNGNFKLLTNLLNPYNSPQTAQSFPAKELTLRADYLAPERTQSGATSTALSDIYALGCTMYQVISGRAPFASENIAETISQHANRPIQPLEEVAGTPGPLAQIITQMMAKNPPLRIQDAAQLLKHLTKIALLDKTSLEPSHASSTLAKYEDFLKSSDNVATDQLDLPAPQQEHSEIDDFNSLAIDSTAVKTASSSSVRSRNPKTISKRKINRSITLGLIAGGLLVCTIIGTALHNPPEKNANIPKIPKSANSIDSLDSALKNTNQSENSEPFILTSDDGKILWAPPTWGSPLSLEHTLPGAQAFLIARPAEILSTKFGTEIIGSLGPDFARLQKAWESAYSIKLEEVEQLTISFRGGDENPPNISLRIRSVEPLDILQRWENPAPQGKLKNFYVRDHHAIFIPPQEESKIFALGTRSDIEEIIDASSEPPLLTSNMQRMLRQSDSTRHFNFLFSPPYLMGSGQSLFINNYGKLLDSMRWFLTPGLLTTMFNAHFEGHLYLEIRFIGTPEKDPGTLLDDIEKRFQEMSSQIEDHLVRSDPPEYWRKLSFRFPRMLSYLYEQSRFGIENKQAVVNTVLPEHASVNLLTAAELSINSTSTEKENISPLVGQDIPTTIQDLLQRSLDLSFPQLSLGFAMSSLEQEILERFPSLDFPFAIKIIGSDLQLDGITQNQQILDFSSQNSTFSDILTQLVLKANPNQGVSPSDTRQKLVWTVGPDPADPQKIIILITTRQQSEKKGYLIPDIFHLN